MEPITQLTRFKVGDLLVGKSFLVGYESFFLKIESIEYDMVSYRILNRHTLIPNSDIKYRTKQSSFKNGNFSFYKKSKRTSGFGKFVNEKGL